MVWIAIWMLGSCLCVRCTEWDALTLPAHMLKQCLLDPCSLVPFICCMQYKYGLNMWFITLPPQQAGSSNHHSFIRPIPLLLVSDASLSDLSQWMPCMKLLLSDHLVCFSLSYYGSPSLESHFVFRTKGLTIESFHIFVTPGLCSWSCLCRASLGLLYGSLVHFIPWVILWKCYLFFLVRKGKCSYLDLSFCPLFPCVFTTFPSWLHFFCDHLHRFDSYQKKGCSNSSSLCT